MTTYMFTFVYMYMAGMYVFLSNRKHLLIMLLGLEFVVISLFMGVFLLLGQMNYEYFFSMVFLSLSVCESALSLALLVLMVRTHSNDLMSSLSSLW